MAHEMQMKNGIPAPVRREEEDDDDARDTTSTRDDPNHDR